MIKNRRIQQFFSNAIVRSILFWGGVYAYYVSIIWPYKKNKALILETHLFELLLQIITAYLVIKILLPKLLISNKNSHFFIAVLVITYSTFFSFAAYFSYRWFEPTNETSKFLFFSERITSLTQYLRSIPSYSLPTIAIVVLNYYRKQKEVANLKEQKKTTELKLLKQQLNPHFLFNTLNNLYVLVLEKSDKAPQIVGKLSEILDYILYQCKDTYVPIYKEIELLENYITLEKVRYGNRVEVIFDKQIHHNVNIAPLVLLNFVENAFKHGVSQELEKAVISVFIATSETEIVFKLKNTKPKVAIEDPIISKNNIGMNNTEKQLRLLYPNAHSLIIINSKLEYTLELKIELNGKV
jgi:LytS/YehU family sensor histidine kinase